MRWNQTWTCLACGHARSVTVRYPKNGGGDNEPLWRKSMRARCTQCGVRGRCQIDEKPEATPSWGERQAPSRP